MLGDAVLATRMASRMLEKGIYVVGFFLASFTDTTIVWNLSYITIAIMTIPNLFGLLVLRKDIKSTVRNYWSDFKKEWPKEKFPSGI